MNRVSPERVRKAFPRLSKQAIALLTVLIETEDYVPDSTFQQLVGVDVRGLGSVMG